VAILAIEGATPTASVALAADGIIKGEIFIQQGTGHARTLMPLVDQLLTMTDSRREDLQAIAVTLGPGSFTGLRIGLATDEGLAMGLQVPLLGITTLKVLASPLAAIAALIVPVLNARKEEVYTALYSGGIDGMTQLGNEKAIAPQALAGEIKHTLAVTGHQMVILTGDGVDPYQATWQTEFTA